MRRMEDEDENADEEEGMRTEKVAGSVFCEERIGRSSRARERALVPGLVVECEQ